MSDENKPLKFDFAPAPQPVFSLIFVAVLESLLIAFCLPAGNLWLLPTIECADGAGP